MTSFLPWARYMPGSRFTFCLVVFSGPVSKSIIKSLCGPASLPGPSRGRVSVSPHPPHNGPFNSGSMPLLAARVPPARFIVSLTPSARPGPSLLQHGISPGGSRDNKDLPMPKGEGKTGVAGSRSGAPPAAPSARITARRGLRY